MQITKRYYNTFRRHNDPTSGTRQECWGADTADGLWTINRTEERGTPWHLAFVPLGLRVETFGSLKAALVYLANGQLLARLNAAVAHEVHLQAQLVEIRRERGNPDFHDGTPEWLRAATIAFLDSASARESSRA